MSEYNFYDDSNYKTLCKVTKRLKEGVITLKNIVIWYEFHNKCLNLMKDTYNHVGYCHDKKQYSWLNEPFNVFCRSLDTYENNQSFNFVLYSAVIKMHTTKGINAVVKYLDTIKS